MKKLLSLIIAFSILATPVMAKPKPHHGGNHHRPAPQRVIKHHDDSWVPFAGLAIGLTGAALALASNNQPSYTNVTYIDDTPNKKCFVLISKSTGKITKKCLTDNYGNDEVVYID